MSFGLDTAEKYGPWKNEIKQHQGYGIDHTEKHKTPLFEIVQNLASLIRQAYIKIDGFISLFVYFVLSYR